jgi:hypothetical protein
MVQKKSRTNRKIRDTKIEFTKTPETQSQLRKTIQKNQPTTYENDFQRKEKKMYLVVVFPEDVAAKCFQGE